MFPLPILWLRQGIGIYLDSAEGSIKLSNPRNQTSASQKLFHPPADKQKCGLENNNKKLVDRMKMVTAEVWGLDFFIIVLEWTTGFQPAHETEPSGSCFSRLGGSPLI